MSRSLRRVESSRHQGVVLVAALLALLLLASAVFFVFNVGTHVHRKIEAQHAADAAVMAGAGWVARGMNLVAMNNVETARLLAQVQVYDGIPSAIRNSLADAEAALTGVENQLQRGLPGHPWVASALREVEVDLTRQFILLEQMDAALNNGYDIAEMTTYELANGQRGRMWRTIDALGQISQTTMRELGVTAQIAAYHAGRENFTGDGRAFLVPIVPNVPWTLGEPEDFIRPITEGLLPVGQDNEVWARGPFDVLFGLREPTLVGSEFVFPPYNVVSDYSVTTFRDGAPPLARGEVRDYRVQAIIDFFRQQVRRAEAQAFDTDFTEAGESSWFAERVLVAVDYNMEQLSDQLRGAPAGNSRIVDANWETDWDRRENIQLRAPFDNPSWWPEDLYIRLVFEAEAVDGQGNPLDGSLSLESWGLFPGDPGSLREIRRDPPVDQMDEVDAAGRVLRDDRVIEVIGANGQTERRTQYVYVVWCAVEADRTVEGRFPNNFNSVDDLPAPIALDIVQLPHNNWEARKDILNFFAAADQSAEAPLWRALFEGGDEDQPSRPWARTVGIASAEVFNNHSWDLWTQMWQAQLIPVREEEQRGRNLAGWLTFAADNGEDGIGGEGFRSVEFEGLQGIPTDFSQQIGETFNYLRQIEDLHAELQQPRSPRSTSVGGSE